MRSGEHIPEALRRAIGDALENYADELLPLRNDKETLSRDNERLHGMLNDRDRTIVGLRDAAHRDAITLEATSKIIGDRCMTIATLESQVYALTRTINENAGIHTRECDRLREDIDERNREITELGARITTRDQRIVNLLREVSRLGGKEPELPRVNDIPTPPACAAQDTAASVAGVVSKVVTLDNATAVKFLRDPRGFNPDVKKSVFNYAADKLEEMDRALNHAANVRVAVQRLLDAIGE